MTTRLSTRLLIDKSCRVGERWREVLGMGDEEDFHRDRGGELGEIGVVREVPVDAVDRKAALGHLMPITDMLLLLGHDLDARLAIGEMDDCDRALFMDAGLCALLLVQTVRDSDMAVPLRIDTRHLRPEKTAMRRCVVQLIDGNIIMDHLVQNRVLYHFFRQVDAHVDTQHKIFIPVAAEPALAFTHKSDLAQEALGMAQFDRQSR